MKKLLLTAIICIIIVSCSAPKDDIPVQILATTLGEKIDGFENLTQASDDYIKYCMESDLSLYSEYIVLYPFAGTEYNEIGIFKVDDANNTDEGIKEVEKYLMFKKSNWDTRYKNDEFSKIENAKITSCGKYILYTILSDAEMESVISAFKASLK